MHEFRNLQFKVDSRTPAFLEAFSWQFYLPLEFLPEIRLEEIAEEIFSYLLFDV